MNKQLYENLKQFWGAIQEVSNRTGLGHQSIKYIIRDGKWENNEVLAIAEQVLKERKSKMHALLAQA